MTTDYSHLTRKFEHPYPLLFMTVSGAHLYGFPSPDSDYDLRGAHLLPPECLLGLEVENETVGKTEIRDGTEIDLVTHDAGKFFRMLLKKNGYVLEQLYSPLIVATTPGHEELKRIARGCVTRFHAHHYLGFSKTQWELFAKENPRRVKPLLYVYRVLLTGIHLMRTGAVEANLVELNREYRLPHVDSLIERKIAGAEKGILGGDDLEFHRREFDRLTARLEYERDNSRLPAEASARDELNDFLIRLRSGQG